MKLKNMKTFEEHSSELNISDVMKSKINRSRKEVVELLSNSSNFEREELENMSDNELVELWDSLEMDSWLDEIENDNG